MTLEEAEEEYGTINGYIDMLRELMELDDARPSDYQETLRDINFIRSQANLEPLNMVQLAERLV